MEHDSSSRSGYHEPQPGRAGREDSNEDWGDDEVKTFSVNCIWACASDEEGRSGAMGYEGKMPWHLAEDMRRFKELTVSHPVIMGRKTWQSLNPKFRPLSKRDNIVVSHDANFRAEGATVVDTIEDALRLARQEAIPDDGLDRSEIWVIGGSQVFEAVLPYANMAYVTYIQARVPADAYAPDIQALEQAGAWSIEDDGQWLKPADSQSDIKAYRFVTYRKNS